MSAAAPAHADEMTLGDLRTLLVEMVSLSHTAEKPRPTGINGMGHPMPGHEWSISSRMYRTVYDHYQRERAGWLVRALDSIEDAEFVFVSTPDAMDGEDFMAIPTTTARQIAMALLAACDRADSVRSSVTSMDTWRAKKAPPSDGDPMT